MHIPDGFLDLETVVTTSILSLAGVATAVARLAEQLPRRKIPLMGLAAAFVFVAQMLNFPIAGGTSGHLVGAVLVAVLLGPGAGIAVMTTVLVIQCLLFADGGVLALGANVLNMAVIGVLTGHVVVVALRRLMPTERGFVAAAAFGAWLSTVCAAVACSLELGWSGVAPWGLVVPVTTGIHALIGLGEAVITALVLVAVARGRPDLLDWRAPAPGSTPSAAWAGILLVLALILALPLASSSPDGLERVAEHLGFAHRAGPALVGSPLVGYHVAGISWTPGATGLAAAVGAAVAFALTYGLAVVLIPRERAKQAER